jgi:hypothetical protein
MAELTLNPSEPHTEAEYQIAIERCLAEMKRLREQIDEDQQEIDRLKEETRAMIAKLRTL